MAIILTKKSSKLLVYNELRPIQGLSRTKNGFNAYDRGHHYSKCVGTKINRREYSMKINNSEINKNILEPMVFVPIPTTIKQ